MLPDFPKFKGLELSDKEEVEKITQKYLPYSDFNFTSMWCWDIEGDLRISKLNGNLVARFTDYLTGEPFYSFLGDNEVNDTAEKLLELSRKEGLKVELKLVPEESIKNLDKEKFEIKEDRDNFDYILSAEMLVDFSSLDSLVQRKKRAVNSLRREYSPYIELLDLSNQNHQENIFEFIKKSIPDEKLVKREVLAINKFIKNYRNPKCLIIGAFINSDLVGFCFAEILKNKFANFHFWKADIKTYKPMYSFILQENAILLSKKYNCEFINIEQDLGKENLRKWKMSLGSNLFFKKYVVLK